MLRRRVCAAPFNPVAMAECLAQQRPTTNSQPDTLKDKDHSDGNADFHSHPWPNQ